MYRWEAGTNGRGSSSLGSDLRRGVFVWSRGNYGKNSLADCKKNLRPVTNLDTKRSAESGENEIRRGAAPAGSSWIDEWSHSMQAADTALSKADARLKDFLRRARGDEQVRAIITLGEESVPEEVPEQISMGEYGVQRRAIADRRRQVIQELVAPVMQQLNELSLQPLGGTYSPVVVVMGTADQVRQALELHGVRHATLDRRIDLIAPKATA